ncbi:Calx-beta domain-containing protein [Chondrinema litorale]|uniref:Calx-beta domain-containing protein n=1 Tax=Chondrinema litorale TaxID=2994555 RepID=UPI0025437BD4|nr:Calx-beta domain-containing protein [Chondrinema litorale]UZR97119.1 hypothetical protein OQ292_23770 [Chondrinema litorale]
MNHISHIKKLITISIFLFLAFSCKDDDEEILTATLSLETDSYTISEGATEALSIPVLLSQSWPEDITVTYTLSGSAIEGTDFETIEDKSVTITSGSTEAFISISPLDNYMVEESDRTLSLSLISPSAENVTLGSITETSISLIDNDEAGAVIATFESVTYTSNEYLEDTVSVNVVFNTSFPEDVELTYTLSGTAVANTNYFEPEVKSVTIPAGSTNASFDIVIIDSKNYDNTNTIIIDLEEHDNAAISLGAESSTTIQIIDPSIDMSVWVDETTSYHRLYTYNTFEDVAVPSTGRKNSDPEGGTLMDESFAFTYYGFSSDNSADPNMLGFRHTSWTEDDFTWSTNVFNMPDFYKDNDYPNTIDMNTSSKAGLYILEAIRFVPTSSDVTSGLAIIPQQTVRLYQKDETGDDIDNPEYFEVEIEGEGTYSYDETDKSGIITFSITFDETSIGNGTQVRHFEIPSARRASSN